MEIGVGRRKEQRKEGRKRTELYLASKGDAACRAADHGGSGGISGWMRAGWCHNLDRNQSLEVKRRGLDDCAGP